MEVTSVFLYYLCLSAVFTAGNGGIQKSVFTFYSAKVDWNTANTMCQAHGGRLAKLDTKTLVETLEGFHEDWMLSVRTDMWIGMFNDDAVNFKYVWSGLCEPLGNYTNWATTSGEPNYQAEHLCIRVDTDFHWRTTQCGDKHSFLCENREGNCTFDEVYNDQKLSVPMHRSFLDVTSVDSCRDLCHYQQMNGLDCWAISISPTGVCSVYFTESQQDPESSELRRPSPGSTLHLRTCYEDEINTTTLNVAVNSAQIPISPCISPTEIDSTIDVMATDTFTSIALEQGYTSTELIKITETSEAHFASSFGSEISSSSQSELLPSETFASVLDQVLQTTAFDLASLDGWSDAFQYLPSTERTPLFPQSLSMETGISSEWSTGNAHSDSPSVPQTPDLLPTSLSLGNLAGTSPALSTGFPPDEFTSHTTQVFETPLLEETITPAVVPKPSTTQALSVCSCACPTKLHSEESSRFMSSILTDLTLVANSTSASRRRRISAGDTRPSARGLGYAGGIIMFVVFGGLLVLDFSTLKKDFKIFLNKEGH